MMQVASTMGVNHVQHRIVRSELPGLPTTSYVPHDLPRPPPLPHLLFSCFACCGCVSACVRVTIPFLGVLLLAFPPHPVRSSFETAPRKEDRQQLVEATLLLDPLSQHASRLAHIAQVSLFA